MKRHHTKRDHRIEHTTEQAQTQADKAREPFAVLVAGHQVFATPYRRALHHIAEHTQDRIATYCYPRSATQ